jgi:hypothetical protein
MSSVQNGERRRCIGVLQPVFLPWIGYFDQINYVDHFVFQDDVQYTAQDWRNRNRVLSASGPTWLVVPVKRDGLATRLCDARIHYGPPWIRKHLTTVRQAYSKSKSVDLLCDVLNKAFDERPEKLVELTIPLIARLRDLMSIQTSFSRASDIPSTDNVDLTGRLLEIATAHEATDLYLGAKGTAYVDTEFLADAGVAVEFQNFEHPVYDQGRGEFVSHMSIIDFIAALGPDDAADYFRNLPKFERT